MSWFFASCAVMLLHMSAHFSEMGLSGVGQRFGVEPKLNGHGLWRNHDDGSMNVRQ
jgi:hypothetical protein